MDLVALGGGRQEVLAPVFDPLDRALEPHGDDRQQHIIRLRGHDLGTKTAADEGGDDPHLVLEQAQAGGDAVAQRDGRLGGGPDGHVVRAFVPIDDDAAVFHRAAGAAVDQDLALDDHIGLVGRLGIIAAFLVDIRSQVAGQVIVDQGSARFERFFQVDHAPAGVPGRPRYPRRHLRRCSGIRR